MRMAWPLWLNLAQMPLISPRADVDPARRIDQNQDLRAGRQPPADLNLLLVASRERAHLRLDRLRFDL